MTYNYFSLFTLQELALLHDWLVETGELYIDIYHIHSAGGSSSYRVRALSELKELVSQQTWPEIAVTIFRTLQYPIRGIADDHLLEQALKEVPDGQYYSIILLGDLYPSMAYPHGSGNSHAELRADFAELVGETIGVGQNPFDIYDEAWFRTHHNNVFMLSVKRNQYKYESYVQNPEKYKFLESILTDD